MEGIEGFKALEPNNQIVELIAFVEEFLPSFVHSQEFINKTQFRKNETRHSSAFCLFMTNNCGGTYYFERESAQKDPSVIDIGVHFGANLIFVIEAKILPTPKGTKSKPRNEHEYVYGHLGGIQRFKDGKHGIDDSGRPFLECGMIAYVKHHDFVHWLAQVNLWIVQAQWPTEECLTPASFGQIGRLSSVHSRANGSPLHLHHFWVLVPNN